MNPHRRLRAAPITLDAPDPDELTDDWILGWQACRAVLQAECSAAYDRGYEDASTDQGRRPVNLLLLSIGCLSGFIVGFLIAVGVFA